MLSAISLTLRTEEWWDHKVPPILAIFYASALVLHRPVFPLWGPLLWLILALGFCAAGQSLINDLADRDSDQAAGKPVRIRRFGPRAVVVLIAVLLAGLGIFAWVWRSERDILVSYLGMWALLSAYSLPPLRLKTRGLWGIVADAVATSTLPALMAVLLVFKAAGAALDDVWLSAVAIWSLGYGVRGIISHQLADREGDVAVGVTTWVARRGAGPARMLGRAALALELLALAYPMTRIGPAAIAGLLFYALLAARDARCGILLSVTEVGANRRLLLAQYYKELLAPCILLASAWRAPMDAIVLLAHLAAFPGARRRLTRPKR